MFQGLSEMSRQAVTARSVATKSLISLDLESLVTFTIVRHHEHFGFGLLTFDFIPVYKALRGATVYKHIVSA